MRALVLQLLGCASLGTTLALAAGQVSPPVPTADSGADALSMRIVTSRSQPTVGSAIGIEAELRNTSNKTLYLKENKIALYIPPELYGPLGSYNAWWGVFPTEHVWPVEATKAQSAVPEAWDGALTLQPGSKYRVIWQSGSESSTGTGTLLSNLRALRSELKFIFFSPGDYVVSVVAEYWMEPGFSSRDYYTATESTSVHMAAPESVILLGAAVGGLVAFILFPTRRRVAIRAAGIDNRYLAAAYTAATETAGAAGSMLLSVIITILTARIAESEFLVRITVSDFWGAIAVGFIASYAGAKALDKLIPSVNDAAAGSASDERAPNGGQQGSKPTPPVTGATP
jgi:hypothetical protein